MTPTEHKTVVKWFQDLRIQVLDIIVDGSTINSYSRVTSKEDYDRAEKIVNLVLDNVIANMTTLLEPMSEQQKKERVKEMLEEFPFSYDKLDIDIDEVATFLYGD